MEVGVLYSIIILLIIIISCFFLTDKISQTNSRKIVITSQEKKILSALNSLPVYQKVLIFAISLSIFLSLMVLILKYKIGAYGLFALIIFSTFFIGFNISGIFLEKKISIKLVRYFIQILIGVGITAWWVFYPSWVSISFNGLLLIIFFLINIPDLSMSLIFIILGGVFVYDIFNVFCSELMGQMAEKSIQMQLPMMLQIPVNTPTAQKLTMEMPSTILLGLGDIFFPGLFILAIMREARKRNIVLLKWAAIMGYVAGLLSAFAAALFFGVIQPALLYIIPCMVIPVIIVAWKQGFVKQLFIKNN